MLPQIKYRMIRDKVIFVWHREFINHLFFGGEETEVLICDSGSTKAEVVTKILLDEKKCLVVNGELLSFSSDDSDKEFIRLASMIRNRYSFWVNLKFSGMTREEMIDEMTAHAIANSLKPEDVVFGGPF